MARTDRHLEQLQARVQRPLLIASCVALAGICLRVVFADAHSARYAGDALVHIAWVAFLISWVALLRAAPDRRGFIRAQWFLTLIVVVGPLALAANVNGAYAGLAAVSAVLLLAPLGRWLLNRGSLWHLLLLGALILATATLGFWRAEGSSFGAALYWATTAVTVGPEGPAPSQTETMAMTVVLGFLGVGFFAAVIGTLVSALMQREQRELERETRVELGEELEELEEQVEDVAQQSEVDNALLAAKLDELMARLAALEARLPPPDR